MRTLPPAGAGSFLHAEQSEGHWRVFRGESFAVVLDLDVQLRGAALEGYGDAGRLRMAGSIRQGFLHNPVGGKRNLEGKSRELSGGAEADRIFVRALNSVIIPFTAPVRPTLLNSAGERDADRERMVWRILRATSLSWSICWWSSPLPDSRAWSRMMVR